MNRRIDAMTARLDLMTLENNLKGTWMYAWGGWGGQRCTSRVIKLTRAVIDARGLIVV
jgi:hypothetical protein